jgi:hypothetical protein
MIPSHRGGIGTLYAPKNAGINGFASSGAAALPTGAGSGAQKRAGPGEQILTSHE